MCEDQFSTMELKVLAMPDNPLKVVYSHFYCSLFPEEPYQAVFNNGVTPQAQMAFINEAWGTIEEEKLRDALSQVSISLSVNGISRYLSEAIIDLEDHTGISKQSQRYVLEKLFRGSIPELIRKNESALALYEQCFSSVKSVYESLLDVGVKAEDARYLLPQASETNLVCTATIAAWLEKLPYLLHSLNFEEKELGKQVCFILKEMSLGEIVSTLLSKFEFKTRPSFFKQETTLGSASDDIKFVEANAKLLNITEKGWRLVYSAFRQCYSDLSASKILENLQSGMTSEENAVEFIQSTMNSGHVSPTEHEKVTLEVTGLSSPAAIHWSRHRLANFCWRKINYEKLQFIIPPSCVKSEEGEKIYTQMCKDAVAAFYSIRKILINSGTSLELANAAAMYVLPNAVERCFTVTMNTRTLIDLMKLRLCVRAQWEIRNLMKALLADLKGVSPVFYSSVGAYCEVLGYCPENEKFACGRFPTLQKLLAEVAKK